MSFPKLSKIVDESQIKIEHKFLVKKYELMLDRLKCVGCGQCSIVCPRDAILFGPAAAVYESKPKNLNAAVVDTIDLTPESWSRCYGYNVPHKLDREISCKISFQNVV